MQAIAILQRVSAFFYRYRLGLVGRAFDLVIRIGFGASVSGRARIGRGVFFHHNGIGIVVNNAAFIGDDCEIGVHVVLGGKAPIRGAPHLERGVIVHAGAKLIGPIRIGEGSIVAANAVVLENMPAHCMIAGMPAVVKRHDIDASAYRHDAPQSVALSAEADSPQF